MLAPFSVLLGLATAAAGSNGGGGASAAALRVDGADILLFVVRVSIPRPRAARMLLRAQSYSDVRIVYQ